MLIYVSELCPCAVNMFIFFIGFCQLSLMKNTCNILFFFQGMQKIDNVKNKTC